MRFEHPADQSFFTTWGWRFLLCLDVLLLSVWAAMAMWLGQPAWIDRTYPGGAQLLELFMGSQVVALMLIWTIFYFPCRRLKRGLWPVTAFLLVGMVTLIPLEKNTAPSYDYTCWPRVAQAYVRTGSPYVVTRDFFHPPLLAQVEAYLYREVAARFPVADDASQSVRASNEEKIDHVVFYAFTCLQYASVYLCFVLMYLLLRKWGVDRAWASVASFLLFVINAPLFRCLVFHQPNLWALASVLAVLNYHDRLPAAAGLALAFGIHLKLYPAVLGLPLLLSRRVRCLVWTGVFILAIFAMETLAAGGVDMWGHLWQRLRDIPAGQFFRDNSVQAVVRNLCSFVGLHEPAAWSVARTVQIAVLVAMGSRVVWREICATRMLRRYSDPQGNARIRRYRFYDHAADALAIGMFLSPEVFVHHYVLVLPLIAWTVLTRAHRAPRRVWVGALFILAVPVFDIAFLSWSRIAGLVLLVTVRPPGIADGEDTFFKGLQVPCLPTKRCLSHDCG